MITEKKFSIDDIEPTLLLGPNDIFLKELDDMFPSVTIISRGSTITLRGEESKLFLLEKIIHEMKAYIDERGNLKLEDVDYIIRACIHHAEDPTNFKDFNNIIFTNKGRAIRAKTLGQRKMLESSKENDILFSIGPAGTGKTYIAVAIASYWLKKDLIKKIVLARPAIEAGESLGFLPGELSQKIEPYLVPLNDALMEMFSLDKLKDYLEKKVIEIVPLAYMRGRTFNDTFILLDEAQNSTSLQMKMFLTRLGTGSKAIVMGDISQIDLPTSQISGLTDAIKTLDNIKGIDFVFLSKLDVVRHKLVRKIIAAYDKKARDSRASSS